MYRVGIIILIAVFQVNCTSSPVSLEFEEATNNKIVGEAPICTANNESEECALTLSDIEYHLPETECQVYDLRIEIDTDFYTPAGMNQGSTTRLDWEFLPNGNAGFWIAPIEGIIPSNSKGEIQMVGCFTFGNQTDLRITRIIEDEDGNESNDLTITIPNPDQGKVASYQEPAVFMNSANTKF